MIPLAALLLAVAMALPAWAAPRVQLELIGDARGSALLFQQWLQVLGKVGVKNVRFRSGQATDRVGIEIRGTKDHPVYLVTGIVKSHDELLLPAGSFKRRDAARLARWLDDLAKFGPEDRREKKTVFGLFQAQFEQVQKDLARRVAFSTRGMGRGDAAAKIARRLTLSLQIDPQLARTLNEDQVAEELSELSCGTALACILRPMGICLVPRSVDRSVVYSLAKADPKLEVWPVGWQPDRPRRELLPAMLEYHNINIQGVSAATAWEAIAKRLKVPVLVDHNALARYGIDPDKVTVDHPGRRTFYSSALRRILFQARLKSELRVDEAGQPFLWITTIRPM